MEVRPQPGEQQRVSFSCIFAQAHTGGGVSCSNARRVSQAPAGANVICPRPCLITICGSLFSDTIVGLPAYLWMFIGHLFDHARATHVHTTGKQPTDMLTMLYLTCWQLTTDNWFDRVMQPAMFDEMGNVNNMIEVHEYMPENLDSLSGFEPPPSPPSRYLPLLLSPNCRVTNNRG